MDILSGDRMTSDAISGRGSGMEAGTPEFRASVPVHIQSMIFEAVAADGQVAGTSHALAGRFGTTPDGLLACLDGLVRAGWVTVSTEPDGLCRIRLEQ